MSHVMGRSFLYGTLGNGGTAYFAAKSDLSTLLDDVTLVRPDLGYFATDRPHPRGAGAAGGVDQQGERVVFVRHGHGPGWPGRHSLPVGEDVIQCLHNHPGVCQLCADRFHGLAVVVDLGVVIENHERGGHSPGLRAAQDQLNGVGQLVHAAAMTLGSVSVTIGCSWAIAALVCSGTDTTPIWPSATSMVV